jgi:cGMP-dependent protein kinase 2
MLSTSRRTQQAPRHEPLLFAADTLQTACHLVLLQGTRAHGSISKRARPQVINEGDAGDLFYIIKEGEAVVYVNTPQGRRKVNHLFKADFFGEKALLSDEPRYAPTPLAAPPMRPERVPTPELGCRMATVEAYTKLVCLTLKRETFIDILGPLEQLMSREKSKEVTAQRMAKLQPKAVGAHRLPAEVLIRRKKKARTGEQWEVVRARGHLDEVQELRKGGTKLGSGFPHSF